VFYVYFSAQEETEFILHLCKGRFVLCGFVLKSRVSILKSSGCSKAGGRGWKGPVRKPVRMKLLLPSLPPKMSAGFPQECPRWSNMDLAARGKGAEVLDPLKLPVTQISGSASSVVSSFLLSCAPEEEKTGFVLIC
jgi:hypothetical protein